MTIDGHEFGLSDIGMLRVTRAASGLPLMGVSTAELFMKVRTSSHFRVGAEVIVTNCGVPMLPKFRISKPGYGNGIAEVTAYDNCRSLDRTFDCAGYFSEDHDYSVSLVTDAIARQCGFASADTSIPHISMIPYRELRGKTCRRILSEISACGCGMWYCSDTEVLKFHPFGTRSNIIGLTGSTCSGIREGSSKGPITRIVAENPLLDEPFVIGTQLGFINTVKVKGRCITRTTAENILTDLYGKIYRAFFCKSIYTTFFPQTFTAFRFNGELYDAVSIVSYLTPYGIYSRVTAPNISEDADDYIGAAEYEDRERIMQEKIYGSTVLGYGGIRFESGGHRYGFSTGGGGLTAYDGGMYSRAGITNAVCSYDPADSSKLTNITYDYCGETMSADIGWSGNDIASVSIHTEEGDDEL